MRINADLPDDRFNWCDALELLLPVILSLLGTKKREVGDWNSEVNLEQNSWVFLLHNLYQFVINMSYILSLFFFEPVFFLQLQDYSLQSFLLSDSFHI